MLLDCRTSRGHRKTSPCGGPASWEGTTCLHENQPWKTASCSVMFCFLGVYMCVYCTSKPESLDSFNWSKCQSLNFPAISHQEPHRYRTFDHGEGHRDPMFGPDPSRLTEGVLTHGWEIQKTRHGAFYLGRYGKTMELGDSERKPCLIAESYGWYRFVWWFLFEWKRIRFWILYASVLGSWFGIWQVHGTFLSLT